MNAAAVFEHGGASALVYAPVERPAPQRDEVVVRVGACSLNALDLFVCQGMPGVSVVLPQVPGGDVVGWVDMVGPGVTPELVGATVLVDPLLRDFRGLRAGVLGENVWGGLAEYVVVPAANVIRIDAVEPERLHVFAALPIGYGTAHRMLFTRAKLEAGETVLVLAATGGVGVACVQLARLHGARVIACSSSASKLDQLKALGADAVIDTSLGDFVARVKELTEGRGADVVIDYIGRDTWQQSILVTKRASLGSREAGRIVTCGASSGFEASTDLRYVWTRELNILGSNAWRRDDLETLIEMVDREELHPIIDSVFSLSRAGDALRRLEARAAFGKVIVVPNEVILS